MRRTRLLALPLVAAALTGGLTGCLSQPEPANDNPGTRLEDQPSQPPPIEVGPSDAPSS